MKKWLILLILLITTNSYSATKNVVPRADSEGNLGTTSKKWRGINTVSLATTGTLSLPNGASPTTDAFGEISADNNAWATSRGTIQVYDGTANTYVLATLSTDTPSNGQIPKWNTGGTITWENDTGGGSSTICIPINPGSMTITGTIALTGDATQGAQIDGSNGQVLLFNDTTDEGAAYRIKLPSNWASHSGIRIMYSMTSGTANEIEWETAIMCQSAGDAERDDADGFAAFSTGVDTVPGTVRRPDQINITPTDDSCASDDIMTINISTDSDDATNDDATGDRRLLGIAYCYTTS